MKPLCLFLMIACLVCSAQSVRVRPVDWAQPVIGSKLGNFYQVSTNLYRSEQPGEKDMEMLQQFGIKSILNLREHHNDTNETTKTALTHYRVEMNAGSINKEAVRQALAIIKNAPKPILIHCWHGSDRTGLIVAMYRITEQHWTREKAIDELEHGGYGYHEKTYPNIVDFIRTVDVNTLQ
jgi:protein tyrosine/serine phosphatase